MSDNSHAYNSVWQLRGDAWCRLDEAADRLTRPTTDGALKERYVAICQDLLTQLTPLEPYWSEMVSGRVPPNRSRWAPWRPWGGGRRGALP